MTDTHDTNDTDNIGDSMERELQSMTQYKGEPTELWKQALEQVEAEGANSSASRNNGRGKWRFMSKPIAPRFLLNVTVAAAALVLLVAVLIPDLGKARSGAPMMARRTQSLSGSAVIRENAQIQLNHSSAEPIAEALGGIKGLGGIRSNFSAGFRSGAQSTTQSVFARMQNNEGTGSVGRSQGSSQESTGRSVIRKVTMELHTPDVAATFLKARQLVSGAGGEFIEDSSLTGEGDAARANLTLRIAPDRLSDVLNELRTLGVVASEQARSEDVTNQVVDLEARLRNEQRVEEELLELLESRADADLNEILKLQSEIGRVRTNIERFIAQRDQLSRLVSLATILVIIRPEAIEPEKPKEASMWVDFKGSINDSWQGGVAFLSNTIAGLVGILVGGLVWWFALIVVWLMIRRYIRAMPEPAP